MQNLHKICKNTKIKLNLAWVLMVLQCQQGAEGRQERPSFSWNHLKKEVKLKFLHRKILKW